MRGYIALFLFIVVALTYDTSAVLAATSSTQTTAAPTYDASVQSTDITTGDTPLVEQQRARIYATVTNTGTGDIEGLVRFFDNETFIGGKVFSLRANSRPEEAWVAWTPSSPGMHVIRVEIANDEEFRDITPADNSAKATFSVAGDIDRDGIGDDADPDKDGDGLTNVQEATKQTDPAKPDTDGDQSSDAEDAFPLDPKQHLAPKPTPPPPLITPKVAAKPVSAPTHALQTTRPDPVITTTAPTPTSTPPETSSTLIVASPQIIPTSSEESTPPPPVEASPKPSRLEAALPTPFLRGLALAALATAVIGVGILVASFFQSRD